MAASLKLRPRRDDNEELLRVCEGPEGPGPRTVEKSDRRKAKIQGRKYDRADSTMEKQSRRKRMCLRLLDSYRKQSRWEPQIARCLLLGWHHLDRGSDTLKAHGGYGGKVAQPVK